MADHLSEEEQIEAIKHWWHKNWTLIVVPIAVLVIGYGSWTFYKSNNKASTEAASMIFSEMMEKVNGEDGDTFSVAQIDAISPLATTLAEDYSATLYGNFGQLMLSRISFEKNEFDQAASQLRVVVESGLNEAVKATATIRLGNVLIEQGSYDEALTVVASSSSDAYKAAFAEVRGDAYFAQGNLKAAQTAYEEALASLTPEQFQLKSVIELKLNGAKISTATVTDSSTNSVESESDDESSVEASKAGES